MELNQVRITGTVEEIKKPRSSPGGVPISIFVVAHRSQQKEAGLGRLVEFEIPVQLSGADFESIRKQLSLGQRVEVQGILTKVSHKQPKSIKLLATTVLLL